MLKEAAACEILIQLLVLTETKCFQFMPNLTDLRTM